MSFGGETVYIVSVGEDLSNRDVFKNPAKVRAETAVRGCRFRPLNSKERNDMTTAKEKKDSLGERVADPWKLTAPPVPAVMNAKNTDELKFNGNTFQLIGVPRVFTDFSGRPYKVTIVVERYLG